MDVGAAGFPAGNGAAVFFFFRVFFLFVIVEILFQLIVKGFVFQIVGDACGGSAQDGSESDP